LEETAVTKRELGVQKGINESVSQFRRSSEEEFHREHRHPILPASKTQEQAIVLMSAALETRRGDSN
jgi:hypothetical protein